MTLERVDHICRPRDPGIHLTLSVIRPWVRNSVFAQSAPRPKNLVRIYTIT